MFAGIPAAQSLLGCAYASNGMHIMQCVIAAAVFAQVTWLML